MQVPPYLPVVPHTRYQTPAPIRRPSAPPRAAGPRFGAAAVPPSWLRLLSGRTSHLNWSPVGAAWNALQPWLSRPTPVHPGDEFVPRRERVLSRAMQSDGTEIGSLADGSMRIRDVDGDQLLRPDIHLREPIWMSGRLWAVDSKGRLHETAPKTAGHDGKTQEHPLPPMVAHCKGFEWVGDQPGLKVLTRFGEERLLTHVNGGGWQFAQAPAAWLSGETQAQDPRRFRLWDDGRVEWGHVDAGGTRRLTEVPGVFASLQPVAFKHMACALRHEPGTEKSSRIVLLKPDDDIRVPFAAAPVMASLAPAQKVACEAVGEPREYSCVTTDGHGHYFAALQDGRILPLDKAGQQANELLPPSDSFPGYDLRDLTACLIGSDCEFVLAARMQARDPSRAAHGPTLLCRYDATTGVWVRLPLAWRTGDAQPADVVRIEPSRLGELVAVCRTPGDAGALARHVYEKKALRRVDEQRSMAYHVPDASGPRCFPFSRRVEGGPSVGSSGSTASQLKDVPRSIRQAVTAPPRIAGKVIKAIQQNIHGRRGLKEQGFYAQVGEAAGLLRQYLSSRDHLPVAGSSLGARLDRVWPPALQQAMRAEERAILKDLHHTVRLIALEQGRLEAGHPVTKAGKEKGSNTRQPLPKDKDVIAQFHAYVGSYSVQRGGTAEPEELPALMELLKKLSLSVPALKLAFPSADKPRKSGPVGVLLARLGLGLERLEQLQRLTHAPDGARFEHAQARWRDHPVLVYTNAGAASVRDVEAFYGMFAFMRKGLTDPGSPVFQSVSRALNVKTPDEVRKAIFRHIHGMNSMELMKVTRLLAAGPTGGLVMPFSFLSLGADGRQVKEVEWKGPGKPGDPFRLIATDRRGFGLKAEGKIRPPVPGIAGVEVQPLGVSYVRLKGLGGLNAFIPEENLGAFLGELLAPKDSRPLDMVKLFKLCKTAERARYSETGWSLTSSALAGFKPYSNLGPKDSKGEYILAGAEVVLTLLGRMRQRLEYLNGEKAEYGLEEQFRNVAGSASAVVGLVRAATTGRVFSPHGVAPQGQTGSLLGYALQYEHQKNVKGQMRLRVPDPVTATEWDRLFTDAAALLPGAAGRIEQLRVERNAGDPFAVARLREFIEHPQASCVLDGDAADALAGRRALRDGLDLLSLQESFNRQGWAMVGSVRLEPRSMNTQRLLKPGFREKVGSLIGRPDPDALPYEQLRSWMEKDPALDKVVHAAVEQTGATRFKLRLEMPVASLLAFNRLLARVPTPTKAEVEAFLHNPQHHPRIAQITFHEADNKRLGGGFLGSSDVTDLTAEREIGTIAFEYRSGEDLPRAYTVNGRLARGLEQA